MKHFTILLLLTVFLIPLFSDPYTKRVKAQRERWETKLDQAETEYDTLRKHALKVKKKDKAAFREISDIYEHFAQFRYKNIVDFPVFQPFGLSTITTNLTILEEFRTKARIEGLKAKAGLTADDLTDPDGDVLIALQWLKLKIASIDDDTLRILNYDPVDNRVDVYVYATLAVKVAKKLNLASINKWKDDDVILAAVEYDGKKYKDINTGTHLKLYGLLTNTPLLIRQHLIAQYGDLILGYIRYTGNEDYVQLLRSAQQAYRAISTNANSLYRELKRLDSEDDDDDDELEELVQSGEARLVDAFDGQPGETVKVFEVIDIFSFLAKNAKKIKKLVDNGQLEPQDLWLEIKAANGIR